MDDAHSLLALAEPGRTRRDWTLACHDALPDLSVARRRELIRLLRDGFLDWSAEAVLQDGLFLSVYSSAPAMGQIDLVAVQWALSHPLTLLITERLVAPALEAEQRDIPLCAVEALVADQLDTSSAESLRKTRTTVLGAMEGVGTLVTSGTGQHRSLAAARGEPHPTAFGYLILRELKQRSLDAMMSSEATETSLAVRLTQCSTTHADMCVRWTVDAGLLNARGDELGTPPHRQTLALV